MMKDSPTNRTNAHGGLHIGVLLALAILVGACSSGSPAGAQSDRSSSLPGDKPDSCVETSPHPVAENIAATYQVEYDQVMDWFCGGEAFDDILLALETRELTDAPVSDLLQRAGQVGWDQVWEEYGVIQPTGDGNGNS